MFYTQNPFCPIRFIRLFHLPCFFSVSCFYSGQWFRSISRACNLKISIAADCIVQNIRHKCTRFYPELYSFGAVFNQLKRFHLQIKQNIAFGCSLCSRPLFLTQNLYFLILFYDPYPSWLVSHLYAPWVTEFECWCCLFAHRKSHLDMLHSTLMPLLLRAAFVMWFAESSDTAKRNNNNKTNKQMERKEAEKISLRF